MTFRLRTELSREQSTLSFFIVDPLDKHPHDPDIQTLMRICNVRNVALATNIATADILICSELLWSAASEDAEVLVS